MCGRLITSCASRPRQGKVTGWVDLSLNPDPTGLVNPHVLNGIAYNGEKGTLLVTGKNWPNLWHIKLVSAHIDID